MEKQTFRCIFIVSRCLVSNISYSQIKSTSFSKV